MKLAKYSLITLRPLLDRIDTVCIGLVVFHGENQREISLLGSLEKIRAFDPSYTTASLSVVSQNLKVFLSDCDSLHAAREMLKRINGSVQIHDFEGSFSYNDEDKFRWQLNQIISESVALEVSDIQMTVIKNLAIFAESLSRGLYVATENAQRLDHNKSPSIDLIDKKMNCKLRKISVINDCISEIIKATELSVNLRESLDWGLLQLRAANDPNSIYYVAKQFISNTDIERLELSVKCDHLDCAKPH